MTVPPFDARTYEELFENANDAIALFALDGTVLLVNGGAERLLQRPRAEIVGHHFREFATPESVVLADQRTQDFLAGRKPTSSVFEITIIRKDGTLVPVEARTRVITDATGKPFRFQGSYRDLTARRRREAAATQQVQKIRAERESYYQALIEHATDMIVILDREGQVQYSSPSCQAVLGYDLMETTGRRGFDFVHPDDLSAVAEAFTAVLATPNATVPLELRVRHKTGIWRVLEATGTNLLHDPVVNGIVINSHDVTARKESETRYRRVSELVSDYAFALHLDAQHNIVVDWLTENFAAVAGFPVEQLLGQPNAILAYIHADDHETIRRALTALQPGACTTYEFRMVRPNAAERRMRSTVSALTNEAGGITIEGASRDITEVRESERKQEQSEERFRKYVAVAPDVIFTLTPEGKLSHLNPAFELYTQFAIEEWLNRDFAPIVHEDDLPLAGAVFGKLLNKETVPAFRLRIKTKSGGYRIGDFHATALIEDEKVVAILGISRDITERVQMEEALAETRRMQTMVADTVPDVICVYDIPQDRVVYINAHVLEVFGVPPHDLLGKGIAALQHWLPEEDHPWIGQRYQQLFETGGMVEVEHGVLHRNGETRWLYSRAVVCHKTREGHPDQILVVGQDITTRKRLEQLMQSQVLAMQELPERLRKFRERLGMTQTEFGREFASRHGPYNNRQMSSYETGDTVVPLELLLAIRAKGFAIEGVLGVGPTDVGEKTVSYFSTKRAEQAVIVELLTALLRVATRDRETMESTLKELRIPGRELSSGERRLLEDARSLGVAEERTRA